MPVNKELFLIVGLGNPGPEYAHTRHNAGFDVMERLERHYGAALRKKLLLSGETAEIAEGGRKLVLCRPLTFMNASGDCVSRLLRWYQCPPERLLVIYDDIDLPPGQIRVRRSGGPGTHNGMRSIVDALGTADFPRIRVGTGDRPAGQDLVSWVLGHYGPEERSLMSAAFDRAAACAVDWVDHGIDSAARLGNVKVSRPAAEG
jgi:PTH1 family peptidyl-tRNA hydrolase